MRFFLPWGPAAWRSIGPSPSRPRRRHHSPSRRVQRRSRSVAPLRAGGTRGGRAESSTPSRRSPHRHIRPLSVHRLRAARRARRCASNSRMGPCRCGARSSTRARPRAGLLPRTTKESCILRSKPIGDGIDRTTGWRANRSVRDFRPLGAGGMGRSIAHGIRG